MALAWARVLGYSSGSGFFFFEGCCSSFVSCTTLLSSVLMTVAVHC
jgi:hypothetical protein